MTHTPAVDSLDTLREQAAMIAKAGHDAPGQASYLSACEAALRFVQSNALKAALTRPPGGSERLLRKIRDLLASRAVDCLGEGCNGEINWPVRDEVIDDISKALARVRHSCETDMLSDCPACSADADAAIANDGAQGAEQRQEGVTPRIVDSLLDCVIGSSRDDQRNGLIGMSATTAHFRKRLTAALATPHPEQAASQGDAVALVQKLIAQWTKQADECDALARRLGGSDDNHTQRHIYNELMRDAAQYRQTVYQGGLILAALSSPTGVQAAQVSDGESALWALRQILHDLPEKREWMDPAVEDVARELVKRNPYADLSAAHGGEDAK